MSVGETGAEAGGACERERTYAAPTCNSSCNYSEPCLAWHILCAGASREPCSMGLSWTGIIRLDYASSTCTFLNTTEHVLAQCQNRLQRHKDADSWWWPGAGRCVRDARVLDDNRLSLPPPHPHPHPHPLPRPPTLEPPLLHQEGRTTH